MVKFLAVFLFALSLTSSGGCSTGSPGGDVFYASPAGAPVFLRAGMESRLLGKLDPNERVVRVGETKGFTHVRARGGSLVGWVHSSRLVRAPASKP